MSRPGSGPATAARSRPPASSCASSTTRRGSGVSMSTTWISSMKRERTTARSPTMPTRVRQPTPRGRARDAIDDARGGFMNSTVTEIAADTYRISTFLPAFKMQFNQYLVKDDEPFLMHTGLRKSFPHTMAAVSRVIDPAALRWIGFSHFEPDECGALNQYLEAAPRAQTLC